VSLLVPIKNGLEYLTVFRENIHSIIGPSDELILVNDNSTDGTLLFLNKWAEQDPRVKVFNNPDVGLVHALNFGLAQATSDWIARFDVDDLCSENRLLIQRNYLHSETAAVFCDYEFISADGTSFGAIHSAVLPIPTVLSLISGQRTPHPGVIFNRKLAIKVGGYLTQDYPAEDLSLWLRLAKEGQLLSAPTTLLKYRINPKSVSNQNRSTSKAKSRDLILQSTLFQDVFSEALLNFDYISEYYKKIESGKYRLTLYVRDLFIAAKLTGNMSSFLRLFSRMDFIRQSPQIVLSVLKLAEQQHRRKLLRKLP
jgi:glycosyltransferase involved in cell wall biosynthesis